MDGNKLLRCSYPQEMLVVFGNAAALEVAMPLIEQLAYFSEEVFVQSPSFASTFSLCRHVLDDGLDESEYEPFLDLINDCVAASLTRTLNEEERYCARTLYELECILAHPFTYEVPRS